MPQENHTPNPQQGNHVQPAVKSPGKGMGILIVFCSIFCFPIGLFLSIRGLCTYPKGSGARAMSWAGLVIIALLTGLGAYIWHQDNESVREMMENIRANHLERNEQPLKEYIQNPDSKKEMQRYVENSFLMELAD